jgi:lambda family phage portal protein
MNSSKRRSTSATKPSRLKADITRRKTAKQAKTARGFDAGKMGRRLRSIPPSRVAINSLIRAYGRNVLARSRYLCANNSYAASAKEEFMAYVVGTGITPNWSKVKSADIKQAIQDAFDLWTDEADADGLTDFYGMQGLIAAELFEAGEIFVRFRERLPDDGFSVPLQLQLLPAEMLPTDYNLVLPNGKRIECGIQFDAIGRREGYWFYRSHPGEAFVANPNSANFAKVFVPASEVIHLYRPVRAGQIRGLPQTLASMITLAMLDVYDDAELERKRTAALFGAFVTKGLGQTDDEDANPLASAPTHDHHYSSTGQVDFSLEPGATVELDYGQDIKFAEPADVGANFEAFQKRALLRASAGMGCTYHGMTGDTGGASFSSMRADQLRYRRRIEPIQHHTMVFQFCRRVSLRWMDAAVLAGAIEGLTARDYLANAVQYKKVKWTPPKWDWVDPLKDITAEKLAVDSGFKARQDVITGLGEDPAETDERIAADQKRASVEDVKFVSTNSGIVVSPREELHIWGDIGQTEDDTVVSDPNVDPNAEEDDQEGMQPQPKKVVPLKPKKGKNRNG